MSNKEFIYNTQLWGGLVNFGKQSSVTSKGSNIIPTRPERERKTSEHEWDHESSSIINNSRKYSVDD